MCSNYLGSTIWDWTGQPSYPCPQVAGNKVSLV